MRPGKQREKEENTDKEEMSTFSRTTCSDSYVRYSSLTVLLEVLLEESRSGHVDTHGREHDGERVLALVDRGLGGHQRGLAADLCGNLIVRQTGGREQRDLLASRNRHVDVDGADTGLDHLLRVRALAGVDGLSLDVQVVLCQHLQVLLVQRLARAVERAAQHLLGDRHLQHIAAELAASVRVVDARSALEDLREREHKRAQGTSVSVRRQASG